MMNFRRGVGFHWIKKLLRESVTSLNLPWISRNVLRGRVGVCERTVHLVPS